MSKYKNMATRRDFHKVILSRLNIDDDVSVQDITISLNLDCDTVTIDSIDYNDDIRVEKREHYSLSLQECKTLFNVKEYEHEQEHELELGPQNEQISI